MFALLGKLNGFAAAGFFVTQRKVMPCLVVAQILDKVEIERIAHPFGGGPQFKINIWSHGTRSAWSDADNRYVALPAPFMELEIVVVRSLCDGDGGAFRFSFWHDEFAVGADEG